MDGQAMPMGCLDSKVTQKRSTTICTSVHTIEPSTQSIQPTLLSPIYIYIYIYIKYLVRPLVAARAGSVNRHGHMREAQRLGLRPDHRQRVREEALLLPLILSFVSVVLS
jgi:hypothetical protein